MTGSKERSSKLIRHPTWVSNRKGAVYDDGFEEGSDVSESDSSSDLGDALEEVAEEWGEQFRENALAKVGKMKERKAIIRERLKKPVYRVEDRYKTKGIVQSIARSKTFEILTLLVISLNAIWLAIDIEKRLLFGMDDSNSDITAQDPAFMLMENVFCAFFTFELGIRFQAFAKKHHCLVDMWFVFDSSLVVIMFVETWVMPLQLFSESNTGGDQQELGLLKLLRLLRLSRIVRMIRFVPELLTLTKGLAAAIRSVFSIFVLLIIALYVFAIIAKQRLGDVPLDQTGDFDFSTVMSAMIVLFATGTLADFMTGAVIPLRDNGYPFMFCVYFLVLLLMNFTILNMLIGVVVDVVTATKRAELYETQALNMQSLIDESHQAADTLNQGFIDRPMFDMMMKDERFEEALKTNGLQGTVTKEGLPEKDYKILRDVLFMDDDKRYDDLHEFTQAVANMSPFREATVMDISEARMSLRASILGFCNQLDDHVLAIRKMQREAAFAVEGMLERIEPLPPQILPKIPLTFETEGWGDLNVNVSSTNETDLY